MTWLALLAAQNGRRAGFMAVAGVTTGLVFLAIIAAAGVGLALDAWPLAWEAIRWAGVLFLVYLAIETWIGERDGRMKRRGDTHHFRRGLIINLLNPKAAAVFVVLIPAFAPTPSISLTVLNSAAYVAIATIVHVAIVASAGSFAALLSARGREEWVRRIFAILLVGVAIWLAISTAR